MTLHETIAKASDRLDELIDDALCRCESLMRHHGCTEDEMVEYLARQTQEFADWKQAELSKLHTDLQAWVRRDGALLH